MSILTAVVWTSVYGFNSMSFLSNNGQLHQAARRMATLTVSGAMSLTGTILLAGSFPTAALAQAAPSAALLLTSEQVAVNASTDTAPPTVEEQIARLDAAVLTITESPEELSTRTKIRGLLHIARAYSELGEQAHSISLLAQAVQIAEDSSSDSYPISPTIVIPGYIAIGETETAENMLAQTVASGERLQITQLITIAEAYGAVGNVEMATSKLSQAVEQLGHPTAEIHGGYYVSNLGSLAKSYSQLPESAITQEELISLLLLTEAAIALYNEGDFNTEFVTAFSKIAILLSQQGNTEGAQTMLARAMERVRGGEETGYITAEVARAYGYLDDKAIAEQALSELMQLALNNLDSTDPIGPVSALGAIAAAHNQLGNPAQAQQALVPIEEAFGESLYMLGALLIIHTELENIPAQQAVIQQMFDKLPLLRNVRFTVSDVTVGYSGLSGLLEAYIATTDDAIAAEYMVELESFFRETEFDPSGISGQLGMLAIAAARRGDDAVAQRLLTESAAMLTTEGEQLTERGRFTALYSLRNGYSLLENEQVKRAGFDAIAQLADRFLNAENQLKINNAIIRARAGV